MRSLLFFVALAAWVVAWVWVCRSGWLPALPLPGWLVLLAASVVPLELLYRRCRPGAAGRHHGVYRDGAER